MPEITFILVSPSRAENIGAAARAIKTMGFSRLHLVQPKIPPEDKAFRTAHGAEDILRNASVYENLRDSLQEADLSVGTTTRKRWVKQEYIDSEKLRDSLLSKGSWVKRIAMVFGGEESGLSNEDLQLCDLASTIPMAAKYPSLNLSHAVMIYAYELAGNRWSINEEISPEPDSKSLRVLKKRVRYRLDQMGLPAEDLKHGRILDRIGHMKESDLKLLQTLLGKLEELYSR